MKTASAAGLSFVGSPRLFSWLGSPGERVTVAVMGMNGRGTVLARGFARAAHAEVAYVCDVDSVVLAKGGAAVAGAQSKSPRGLGDFRKALEDKDVDALVIAAPDHWHTPAALLRDAGGEARLCREAVRAQPARRRAAGRGAAQAPARRADGNATTLRAPFDRDHPGDQRRRDRAALSRAHLVRQHAGPDRRGKTSARTGEPGLRAVAGPGAACVVPRQRHSLQLALVPALGTGEILNNGTHEIDVARWALGASYPTRVTSVGGRYHYADDWEFPDTQEAWFEFAAGRPSFGRGKAATA